MNVTQILARAEKLAGYSITATDAYVWMNDSQEDIGADAPAKDSVTIAATKDIWYDLPRDFLGVISVYKADGREYPYYSVSDRQISFGTTDTYLVVHRRLPGPIVHKEDDKLNIATADATTLPTLILLANAIKTQHNVHRVSTAYHLAADNVNAITSADATDLPTAIVLLNEAKGDTNAHRSQANIHVTNDPRHIIDTPNATDLPTALALANAIKASYNKHLPSGLVHESFHRALALYAAYQKRVVDKPDSNHSQILYRQYLDAKLNGGTAATTAYYGNHRAKGWW